MAPRMPSGTAMSAARAVISMVPRTAGPIPPTPIGSTFGGIGLPVRNCQLMAEAPLAITVYRTKPSGSSAKTKATHISVVAIWFLARRQPAGSRRSTVGCPAAVVIRPPLAPGGAFHDPAGDQVDDDGDEEQQHAKPDQRGPELAGSLAELVRDDRGHVVAGREQVRRDHRRRPDDQGGRDRLAHGPAQAEQGRADDAA